MSTPKRDHLHITPWQPGPYWSGTCFKSNYLKAFISEIFLFCNISQTSPSGNISLPQKKYYTIWPDQNKVLCIYVRIHDICDLCVDQVTSDVDVQLFVGTIHLKLHLRKRIIPLIRLGRFRCIPPPWSIFLRRILCASSYSTSFKLICSCTALFCVVTSWIFGWWFYLSMLFNRQTGKKRSKVNYWNY